MEHYSPWVDEHIKPRGPCGICGGPDARHRIIDAILDTVKAGDSVEFTANNFDLPVDFVRRLVTDLHA